MAWIILKKSGGGRGQGLLPFPSIFIVHFFLIIIILYLLPPTCTHHRLPRRLWFDDERGLERSHAHGTVQKVKTKNFAFHPETSFQHQGQNPPQIDPILDDLLLGVPSLARGDHIRDEEALRLIFRGREHQAPPSTRRGWTQSPRPFVLLALARGLQLQLLEGRNGRDARRGGGATGSASTERRAVRGGWTEGGRTKEGGGRRKDEGGRRKDEGGRRE